MNCLRKLVILLSIIAVTYADDDDMSLDDAIDALMAFSEDCDPKPEKEHAKEVILHTEDAKKESKCLMHCLMDKFDLISDGQTKMNKDNTLDAMGMICPDKKENLGDKIDECNAANDAITDKCENAHAHAMCCYNKLEELGCKMPKFK